MAAIDIYQPNSAINQSSNQQVQNHTATGFCKSIHSTCYNLKNESLHSLLRLPTLSQSAKLHLNGQYCWIFGSMHPHQSYTTFVFRGVCVKSQTNKQTNKQTNTCQILSESTSVSSAWRTLSLPCQRKHLCHDAKSSQASPSQHPQPQEVAK